MPSDVVQDATAQEVTPFVRKGALGKWRALKGNTGRMLCRETVLTYNECRAGDQTI